MRFLQKYLIAQPIHELSAIYPYGVPRTKPSKLQKQTASLFAAIRDRFPGQRVYKANFVADALQFSKELLGVRNKARLGSRQEELTIAFFRFIRPSDDSCSFCVTQL